MYKLCTILALLSCPLLLQGQSPPGYQLLSRRIGGDDGLTNLFVHHTMKDSRGFVWMSTNGGLFVYDGKRARPVITKLGTNLFRAGRIFEGPEQCIWVSKYGYSLFSEQPYSDDGFAIWCDTQRRLLSADSILEHTGAPFDKADVESIAGTDTNTIVFLLSDGRIIFYDGQAYRKQYQIQPGSRYQDFYAAGQMLFLEKLDSCLYFDLSNDAMAAQSQTPSSIRSFRHSCNYQYLEGDTTAQIKFYGQPGVPALVIPALKTPPIGLAHTPNGFLWAVTPTKVIVYAPAPGAPSNHYEKVASATISLSPSLFQELRIDPEQQQAWIASADGVYLLQLEARWFETFHRSPDNIIDPRGITSDQNGAVYFNARYLYKQDTVTTMINTKALAGLHLWYEAGGLWSSFFGPNIARIDLGGQHVDEFRYFGLKTRLVTTWLHRSHYSDELMVGSTKGLLRKPAEADTLTKVLTGTLADQTEIRYIHENKSGLWLCTTEGLFLYDERADTCLDYRFVTQGAAVNHLYESPDGSFWLATFGQGLYSWVPETSLIEQYNYQDGLSDEQILAVYPDQKGFFWMPTNYGLIRFHPSRQELHTFTTKDGLPNNEFNLYAHHQMADGTLVFGTLGGMVKFDPQQIPDQIPHAAPVRPTQIEIVRPGKKRQFVPLNVQELTLRAYSEQLSLDVILVDYRSEELEQFDYRLIGQSAQWAPMQGGRIELAGLSPGRYTLEVRGRKGKEAFSNTTYRLLMIVPPPFYKTLWFILSVVAVLVSALLLIFRWRTQRLRKERAELQQEVQKRTQKIQQQALALQQLNQTKKKLITNIAHELKTPLTLISGAIQLLKNKQHPNPESGLKTIDHNSKRLVYLIDQLLEVNKKEKALLELQTKPADLKKLLREVCQNYEDRARIQQIDLQLDLSRQLHSLYHADALKLEYILHNLLSNAFKFTPKGGSIKLSACPNQKSPGVYIAVADTGVGIPEAYQPRIFERFFQVDATAGGMGIGLAIVKDYATVMGGEVFLESKPGYGTTVKLHLPLSAVASPGPVPSVKPFTGTSGVAAPTTTPGLSQKPTILIVEDHPEVQALLKTIFEQRFELATAANGQEALNLMERSNRVPALVITDLMMPKVDGISFIKRLKADERFRLTPVLVVSAKSDPISKIEALNIGVDDYVQKPFHIAELKAIAQTLLSNATARLNAQVAPASDPPAANGEAAWPDEIKQHEKEWLDAVEKALWNMVDKGIEVKVAALAQQLHTSERQLQRQIKLLTGLTPSEYINEVRLQKARQLIHKGSYSTVAEVAYQVGYTYPNYFSKIFTKRFGRPPSFFFKG